MAKFKISNSKVLRYSIISAIVLFCCIGGGVSAWAYQYYYSAAVKKDGYLYIPTGATYKQELDSLTRNGFVTKEGKFKRYARRKGIDKRVKPGRYKLADGMSYNELIGILARGEQSPVNLTFNNIRTKEKLAGVISKYIEADSLSILNRLSDPTIAQKYGRSNETFISMFIPNTYQFFWNTDADGFLNRMQKEYERFWNEEREAKRKELGLSREEVATLASIVNEETLKSDEMARVAGVYMNRLKVQMPLQADPTVKFAVGDFTLRRILFKHLAVESPYNTYKYKGLPPGPICVPSIKAIDAVLNYEHHKYLYFCAKEDFSGYHNFAVTLAEHNRNAQAYARALNQRGIR